MYHRDQYLLRQSDEFHLGSGEEAAVNLSLKKAPPLPSTKLHGQVISSCKTIAGATVKVLDKYFRPLYHSDTNEEGYFSFTNTLMPGEYQLIAVADGYVVSNSCFVSLTPLIPIYVSIPLKPDINSELGTLYGVLRNELNRPLADAQVCLFSDDTMVIPNAITTTNEDGEYLFYGLNTGNYIMTAFLHGYTLPDPLSIKIYPKEIAAADIYLYRLNAALLGTITGKVFHAGRLVPHAMIALYQVENDSSRLLKIQNANEKGEYLFSGLTAGEYVVKAKLSLEDITIGTHLLLE